MNFSRKIISQFGRPSGFLGNLAGFIMAHNPSNRERNLWTVSLLDIKPHDRVLEIGFGPGMAIEFVSRLSVHGFVAGIDHSEAMLKQAIKRNKEAIREGRVDLQLGSVVDFPFNWEPFDKIFSINSIRFWDDPILGLRNLKMLLKQGGLVAITLQPRNAGATDESAYEYGKEIVDYLERAGFSNVGLEIRRMKPVASVCAIGVK